MKLSIAVTALLLFSLGCSRTTYRLASSKRDEKEILLVIMKGKQQIEASCGADNSDCQDLALRTGQAIDCYVSPRDVAQTTYYNTQLSANRGFACHVREGHGRVFVVHSQNCVDVRQVDEPSAVLHKTEDPRMAPYIGKLYTTVTVRCTNVSNCSNDFKFDDFREVMVPLDNFRQEMEQAAKKPDSGFEIVWQPAKCWVKKGISDAELLRHFQEDLDSRTKDEPKHQQHFDSEGVRLPDDLQDFERDVNNDRFCKDNPDKYFNEHGKEVPEDDTVQLEVRSIK